MGKKDDILRITPGGQDPVVYWHQVAQDAIDAREKTELRLKMATNDLERTRNAAKIQSEEYGRFRAEQRHGIPTVQEMLGLVRDGEIDLDLQMRFTKHYEWNGKG